jgi:medium-chain acyl-[acyl-carrier-protein] hydrolase
MKSASTPTQETTFFNPNAESRIRLFCFPYAGAGASIFRGWASSLPAEIEIIPVQLPGRETRIREAPLRRIGSLVDLLVHELDYQTKPFAFFGHSMGALISYQLAHKLRDLGRPGPVHLFISGRRAPEIPEDDSLMYQLDDGALLEKLRQLNGTPEEVFKYPELVDFWLQIFRADLELCETYLYEDTTQLTCPITAFGGLEDAHVQREEMDRWRSHTLGDFELHMLPGDHFFLRQSQETLLRAIENDLKAIPSQSVGQFENNRSIAV